jgi:hypothetical protein
MLAGAAILNRPEPLMGPGNYKTYSLSSPPRTHFRPAPCEEYHCEDWRFGFITTCDLSTDIGQKMADIIRHDKTRSPREIRTGLYEVKFDFPPGTRCWKWKTHKVPVGRPPILRVRGGDWRASTGLIRRHTRIEFWVEDFAEHQDKLAAIAQRG